MTFLPSGLRLRDYGVAALLLTAAADALFFDRPGGADGLAVPLYVALLAATVAVCHHRFVGRHLLPLTLLLGIALLALVENVGGASFALAFASLAAFALAVARRLPAGLAVPAALGRFLAATPLALLADDRRRRSAKRRSARRGSGTQAPRLAWLVWVMPLVLALGFVLLLGAGNPILERWLALIDPWLLLELVDPIRILFWVLVVGLVWPFLRPRLRRSAKRPSTTKPEATDTAVAAAIRSSPVSLVYGPAAILRALVLFNAVFAVQTLLDAVYLWGGLELPKGVSYAAYAHRGAYTLVATALLAAGFVLLALRPGTAAAADRRVRGLVYLWIGQNVVLILSAMLRLDLYVDVYALTHWRLAAFAWMGTVAAGLVLICVRVASERSNRWLVGANLVVLALVFAGSCFVDDDALIARFNVAHSREVSGEGVPLDTCHLASLGPAAIPAIDRFLDHIAGDAARPGPTRKAYVSLLMARDDLERKHRRSSEHWRNWSFRGWRLSRYLDTNATPHVPALLEPEPQQTDGPN